MCLRMRTANADCEVVWGAELWGLWLCACECGLRMRTAKVLWEGELRAQVCVCECGLRIRSARVLWEGDL